MFDNLFKLDQKLLWKKPTPNVEGGADLNAELGENVKGSFQKLDDYPVDSSSPADSSADGINGSPTKNIDNEQASADSVPVGIASKGEVEGGAIGSGDYIEPEIYFFRFVILMLVTIPSIVPGLQNHFSLWIGLNGTTTGCTIAFIFPILLHLKICWHTLTLAQKITDFVFLFICIPVAVVVLVFTIQDLVAALKAGVDE